MPGLVPGIHVLAADEDVDGRDKPGHDGSFLVPVVVTPMGARMNTWLLHQQRRFMRPDRGRYLRPDIERYLAPERKWDGQPRIEEGEGAGQFTFGTQSHDSDGGDDAYSDQITGDAVNHLEEIVVVAHRDSEGGSAGEPGEGDWINSSEGPGMGHNRWPGLEDPPEIPEVMPKRSSDRMALLRSISDWIGLALGVGARLSIIAYIGATNHIGWFEKGYLPAIESYRDPPRTLKELQAGVGKGRPGYEDHHIIEQTAAQKWGLTRSEIDDASNIVSIPRLKHYQITGWFKKANPQFGGLSPRQYLSDKGVAERRAVGLQALELYKVLVR